jgi:hypothetical protein
MKTLPHDTVSGMAPQLRLVYDYLMTGRELSGLIAMTNLSVMNLTTRIAELRKMGLDVKGDWKDDYRGRRYKAYWVEAE